MISDSTSRNVLPCSSTLSPLVGADRIRFTSLKSRPYHAARPSPMPVISPTCGRAASGTEFR